MILQYSLGADPKKNYSVEFDSTVEYWPIKGAKNGHMTNIIGQIPVLSQILR